MTYDDDDLSDDLSDDQSNEGELESVEVRYEVVEFNLEAGTNDFYEDPEYYAYEFKDRREDVRFYGERYLSVSGWSLEIGVGTARIALPAARKGAKIVGLDLHQGMLDAAERRRQTLAKSKRGLLRLVHGDMRDFDLGERFELITCPFNALQHMYTHADVSAALERVKAHLAPGGRFIFDVLFPDLEYLNRPAFQRFKGVNFKHPTWGATYNYSERSAYDPVQQLNHMFLEYERVEPPIGEPSSAPETHQIQLSHRYFFPQELDLILANAGLRVIERFGDFEGAPVGQGESMVMVCERA